MSDLKSAWMKEDTFVFSAPADSLFLIYLFQ